MAAKLSGANTNSARATFKVRSFKAKVEVSATPAGLVAVGFLVASILVSVAPIILAATRKLPHR